MWWSSLAIGCAEDVVLAEHQSQVFEVVFVAASQEGQLVSGAYSKEKHEICYAQIENSQHSINSVRVAGGVGIRAILAGSSGWAVEAEAVGLGEELKAVVLQGIAVDGAQGVEVEARGGAGGGLVVGCLHWGGEVRGHGDG